MIDFSQLLGPAPTPQAPQPAPAPTNDTVAQPDLKSQWDGFIQNNRAAMLSFGLQALSGGWGNGAQQFAHALGKGLETAGNQEVIAQEQANKDASLGMQQQRIDQDERQHRDNMALSRERIRSQEKIADSNAAAVASRDEQRQFQQLVMNNLKILMAPQGLSNVPAMTLEEALPLAKAQAEAALGGGGNRQLPGNLSSGNGQQSSAGMSGPGSVNGRVEPTSGRTKEEQISPNANPPARRNPKTGEIARWNAATNRWEIQKGK